jgi:hypothetical protein
MNQPVNLTLEQEFNLRVFSERVENLTPEQAKEFLVEINRQMMIRDNLYRDLLKQYMGMNTAPMSL